MKNFLQERGLELSSEKTKVTYIQQGFNIRKYDNKLFIKPSRKNVGSFLEEIKQYIESNPAAQTNELIRKLNSKIRGWANYHRHVVAKRIFQQVDHVIFWSVWRWIKKRHPNKSASWRYKKYFRTQHQDRWIFFAKTNNKDKDPEVLDLLKAANTPIVRHLKIQSQASPFDPTYEEYFKQRERKLRKSTRKLGYLQISLREA